jgi:aspartyl-tRNA synthetase
MNITHHNYALNLNHVGQNVALRGWVARSRRMGGIIFIDLRDRFGVTQLQINQDHSQYDIALTLRSEFVIHVTGHVIKRENPNLKLATGEIEVVIEKLTLINESATPPIGISDQSDTLEETRLKYRYLDLRRPEQQQFLIQRHHITQAVRHALLEKEFYELETPILGKSTPEGARDFLVPSRLYEGHFYALPQSPQIYKQLYMMAGFEKYFQMARCFRDEDLRADRQLEFTQIDIEASFVEQEDMLSLTEHILSKTFKQVLNYDITLPIEKMSYDHAMQYYGSDKPDLRFDLQFKQMRDVIDTQSIEFFNDKEVVFFTLQATIGRKQLDELTHVFKKQGGAILASLKRDQEGFSGSLDKHLTDTQKHQLLPIENTMIVCAVGSVKEVYEPLGVVRQSVATMLQLFDPNAYRFVWIVDFPLFEYDDEEKRFYAKHHPFTAPKSYEEMKNNPEKAKASAYDIVLNGYEIGGGSIRIHHQNVQQTMFETLGLSKHDIEHRFGFFTEALKYGTPPHGGIALGLDRLVMLMTHTSNIKDVVAFPKTQSARDLMMEAPSDVSIDQLNDIHIEVKP